jgi:hypothetical protein
MKLTLRHWLAVMVLLVSVAPMALTNALPPARLRAWMIALLEASLAAQATLLGCPLEAAHPFPPYGPDAGYPPPRRPATLPYQRVQEGRLSF